MPESSLEKLVPETDFAGLLEGRAQLFFRLSNTLREAVEDTWTKRHYFQLHTEADELESFLDDYGARYNRTYHFLTELTASIRGMALAGLSLEHLSRRIEGYGVLESFPAGDSEASVRDLDRARKYVERTLARLLVATEHEALELGIRPPRERLPASEFTQEVSRFRLPRNVGQEEIQDEEQRIAEVASKYIQACTMFEDAHVERLEEPEACEARLRQFCSEEHARVYEATVHNLQSAYDTHIKNTVLEARDDRLGALRGHVSSTLHLLEAVTQLTHFVERHESGARTELAERRMHEIVDRRAVREITLNALLYWAHRFMQHGSAIAEELLAAYMNVQALEVELASGIVLHARPVALIAAIVNHYGTPVELELHGKSHNAGSILELMIAVGSSPNTKSFVFRGDEHPLRDIGLLFENALGEKGLELLPGELDYLRS